MVSPLDKPVRVEITHKLSSDLLCKSDWPGNISLINTHADLESMLWHMQKRDLRDYEFSINGIRYEWPENFLRECPIFPTDGWNIELLAKQMWERIEFHDIWYRPDG